MTLADATLTRAFFSAIKSRESEHVRSSVSIQQEGHDRSQVPSSQLSRELGFRATLLCRSRDFVKSSAERAHRWTRDAHRARGIAWTLFMRRERGPRLDMEPVDGSGKGVGEEESGRRTASVGALMIKIPHFCRHHLLPWRAPNCGFLVRGARIRD